VETLNLREAGLRPSSKGCAPIVKVCHRRGIASSWFALLLLLLFSTIYSPAQKSSPTESQVKAAYLFNFARFVRWTSPPAHHDDSLQICVLGKNPFGTVLDATVKGERIDGRPVITKNISTLHEVEGCHILFVSASEESHLSATLATAKKTSALAVSDIPHFIDRGGMIGFVAQEERIRFEVNTAPVDSAGLTVSSELLKVALRVIHKSGGGD
jgi:hypothetical protein